jgi:hypothetical protein
VCQIVVERTQCRKIFRFVAAALAHELNMMYLQPFVFAASFSIEADVSAFSSIASENGVLLCCGEGSSVIFRFI